MLSPWKALAFQKVQNLLSAVQKLSVQIPWRLIQTCNWTTTIAEGTRPKHTQRSIDKKDIFSYSDTRHTNP
jgi:hypothetical protein